MDRPARNVDELRRLVQEQTKRCIRVQFIKENLTFAGEDSPIPHLMLSVLGSIVLFERDLIKERQREGIALAKQRGAYHGRKRALPDDKLPELLQKVKSVRNRPNSPASSASAARRSMNPCAASFQARSSHINTPLLEGFTPT